MQYRNHLLGFLTLLGLVSSFESHAVVTVYCCDATAEAQFIQDLSNLPSISPDITKESFEGSAWDGTRSTGVQSVTSQGITWAGSSTESSFVRTSTSGGDVHEGSYLMFPVDNRNDHLVPDKYTLTASGTTLYGVGGWFRSSTGAKIGFTTNGSAPVDFTGSQATVTGWTFLGFIDDAGFTNVLVEAVDEGGDEVNIFFSDDFTLGAQSGAFPGQKLQFSSATYSVAENAATLQLTVERTGGTSGAISVDYATDSDSETDTASANLDYTPVSGTLNFADGESSQQISIDILDDTIFEDSETFTINLSGLNIGAQNSATVTITDNDAPAVGEVQFSSSTYTFSEGDGSVTITVQRDGGSSGSGSVDYAMSDATATAGSDYTAASGTLSFVDGQISSSITLAITDDATTEGTESLLITLSNPVSVSLAARDVTEVSITDNEPVSSSGSLQFSGSSYTASEGDTSILLPVTRTNGSSGAVSITCSTSDLTATAGSDYTATQATVSFADGELTSNCVIPVLDDSSYEADETLMVTLATPAGGAVLGTPASAVVTLSSDDPIPAMGSLQFSLSEYQLNEDGGIATISVSRSGGSSGSVGVSYATSDSTATAGEDYTAASGSVNFADGGTSGSFQVTLLDDSEYEGDERVTLTLSNPTGGAVLGQTAQVDLVITEDDAAPASGLLVFSASDLGADEADGLIEVTVERHLDDSSYEADETLMVTLSTPTGGAVLGTPASAVVTLSSDDPIPAMGSLQFSLSEYQLNEDGGTATIAVSRSGGSSGTVGVSYASSDSTATAGEDYTAASGSVSFADGVTSGSFQVTLLDDSEYEGDERITLTLSNPTGGAVLGPTAQVDLVITEDDAAPATGLLVFSASDLGADEADGLIEVTVERQGGSSGAAQVNYATADGTAIAGIDYQVASGTLMFADGELSKTFEITIVDDALFEGTETINLILSDAVGASLGDTSTATISVTDDDVPPAAGSLIFSNSAITAAEDGGDVTVTVSRSGGSTGAVSVDYNTADGTAIASSDYTYTSGNISFADGDEADKTFTVPLLNDTEVESDETILLQMSNFQGGAVAGDQSSGQITITDDDVLNASTVIGFTITSLTVNESSVNASFTIDRSVVLTGTVSVDLSVGTSTAVAGSDFNVTTGTLQFASGETQKTINVEIIDNTVVDGDRTITFVLGNVSGTATIDSNSGSFTLTISDDDQDGGSDGDDNGGGGGGGGSADLMLLLGLMIIFFGYLQLQNARQARACAKRRVDEQ
ncbi:hypothetical protein A3195_13330 [Candidatus Thiodiazotropha endoloripes]|uniref:Calx-beta domain-containing protein n=1 Tax=Candidatus Thiodiazotropha endoloripes TaxID=1818881 RepID=UPI00083E4A9B|nr:Calx-beta domain-containing protein [Candidatus Thiodiazotropha endoloripes]ODB86577.1 hypothetical protein A3195_13330 [Candidatus Thiodiazotropha endoloripes]